MAETVVGTAIGFVLSYLTNMFAVPVFFHIQPSHSANVGITTLFTVLSLARSFLVRRWFNRVHVGRVIVQWAIKHYTAAIAAFHAAREEWWQ